MSITWQRPQLRVKWTCEFHFSGLLWPLSSLEGQHTHCWRWAAGSGGIVCKRSRQWAAKIEVSCGIMACYSSFVQYISVCVLADHFTMTGNVNSKLILVSALCSVRPRSVTCIRMLNFNGFVMLWRLLSMKYWEDDNAASSIHVHVMDSSLWARNSSTSEESVERKLFREWCTLSEFLLRRSVPVCSFLYMQAIRLSMK